MAISRYNKTSQLNFGSQYGSSDATRLIRAGIKDGSLPIIQQFTLKGSDRLDTLAGSVYKDSRYWWILAAVSNIGWGLQVPPGTVINVVDLKAVQRLVG
jgi:hypothetical protein